MKISRKEFEELLDECFSGFAHINSISSAWDYSQGMDNGVYRTNVETGSTGLTYAGLKKMCERLGTEDIDINSWAEHFAYSEYTTDDSNGLKFTFRADEVEIEG